jgi:hypothetical protein
MADDVQYIKLPDGSYGKFAASAKDEDIQSAISKDFPNAFKPSEAEQVANRPAVPRASLPGALNPNFGKLPASLATLPRNSRTGMPMGEFQPAEDAQRQAAEENIKNLGNVAKTGQDLPGSLTKQTALRTIGDISGVAEGAFSPTSIAIAAANTNPWTGIPVDAAFVGHGLFNAGVNAPSAVQGNPDAVQKSLFGLSEAAGGAAGVKGGFEGTADPLTKASRSYQQVVSPKGTSALSQLENSEEFNRAAPYLKQAEAESPVQAKQTSGPLKGQRLGVLNYRQNALAAADKLWQEQITPRTESYGQVPIDHAGVASDIRGTLNPNSPVDAAKASAVNDLADFYDNPTTVSGAMEKVKALNEDTQIQAYEKATPDKQAEMVGANPQLEAKLKAADSLRSRVFDAIKEYGEPADADYIQEARKDFGALKGVAQKLGTAKVPTPESLPQRLMNTVHGAISPFGAHAYTNTGALDTLFRVSDPNRLASVSSRSLSDAALSPRSGPPIRSNPWAPPEPQYPDPIGPYYAGPPSGGPVGNPPPLGFGAQYDPMWDRVIQQNAQPGFEGAPASPQEIITPTLPSYSPGYRNLPETLRRNLPASLRALSPRKQ